MEQKPSIGRIVHFHPYPPQARHKDDPEAQARFVFAAIIVYVNTDGTVNLHTFHPTNGGTTFREHVQQGEGEGQWQWPPRV